METYSSRARFHYGWVVLLLGLLVVTAALGLGRFAYTMILPHMRDGLGLNYTQMGLLASANFVGYTVSALVCGVLAARYGLRRVIGGSLLLAGVTLLLTGLSPSFEFALAMRTLTGVGSAGANVPAMALVSSWFAVHRRGTAAGFMVAGSGVGVLISGQVIPAIMLTYGSVGWRYSWYFLGVMVLVLGLVIYRYLRDRPQDRGLKPLGERESDARKSAVLRSEPGQQASPSVLAVPRSRAIWHLSLIYVAFGFAYVIYATFFAAYLQQRGLSAKAAGDLWALVGVLSLFSGLLWGTFSDRAGRRWGLVVVFLLQGLAFLLFALVPTPIGFLASAVVFGLAAWSVPAIMSAAAGDYMGDARLTPAALGFMTFFFGAGQAVGPSVAGFIGDSLSSLAPAFLLAAAAALLGAAGSLRLRPPGRT